jgi:tripartite-type tricarboxylate transporter receptor subunit TctC
MRGLQTPPLPEMRFTRGGGHLLSHCFFLLCAVFVATAAHGASGAAYPSKPVRFIVPFAPGGGNDLIARIIGQKLAAMWNEQFVVDNRPGAGGNVAAETTARAAPDGYTVFQFNIANVIAPSLYPRLNYDPVRDFAAVTQLATNPFMLVVHTSVNAKTVSELIVLAKSQPGKLNYASSGNGGLSHLVAELFKSMASVDMVHVPYNGTGPAVNELLSGRIQVLFTVPSAVLGHIKSGRLRVLGVCTPKRIALAPEVPTVAEAGVPGFEGNPWYGVVVPARTPETIVNKLYRDIARILQEPELRERMASQGTDLVGSNPAEFSQFIKREIVKWARAVKVSGARVD